MAIRKPSFADSHSACSAFPIVLSSPSGAGKTSIARGVIRRDPRVVYSVSATTRPIRPGEKDHRAYHFFTDEEFRRRKRTGYFVETAQVYDHSYGTPRPFIEQTLDEGKDAILDLDIQGARSMRRLFPGAVTVFITVPDFAELTAAAARAEDRDAGSYPQTPDLRCGRVARRPGVRLPGGEPGPETGNR